MKKLLFVLFVFMTVGSLYAQELNPTVKFNFLRGRDAFQRGDYQTAFKELKAYVDVDGKNHHALNLLAQVYHKLNRIKEAEATYLKAIEAAPADTFAPIYSLNLGVFLYDQKKYDQALPHLTNAAAKLAPFPRPFNEKKGLAYYYKAFIFYNREQWQDAKANFEKANYYSIDLKQGASFYQAICEYKLGNTTAARDGFKLAEKLNTSRALTDYSKRFLETLQSYKKPTGFGLTTGFQATYDSNIFLEPKEYRSHSSIDDKEGESVGLVLEPYYRAPVRGWNFLGKYNFTTTQQVESKHNGFDSYFHKLSGIFAKGLDSEGKKKISFDTALEYVAATNHKRVKYALSENVGYSIDWTSLFSTEFQLGGAWADYPSPSSGVSADNRDGLTVSLSEINSWYLVNQRLKFNLGVGGGRTETRGDTYNSTSLLGFLGFNFPFFWDSQMDIGGKGEYAVLSYDKTFTATITAGLFKNWSHRVSSSLGISHIRSKGDEGRKDDALRYDRNLVMFNIFYQI